MKGRSWVLFAAGITVGVAVGAGVYFAFIHDSGSAGETKPYVVPSEAMAPTIKTGEHVQVDVDAYENGTPRVGDIVVFHPPAGADNGIECGVPHPPDEVCPKGTSGESRQAFVKRIVAGPGDKLSIEAGHPVVNGVEETDAPYVAPCGSAGICNMPKTITVPAGTYFMLGDNRGASDDSRFWGPVPAEWIIGRVE